MNCPWVYASNLSNEFFLYHRKHGCDSCGMSIITHRFHSNTRMDFDLCLGCLRKEEQTGYMFMCIIISWCMLQVHVASATWLDRLTLCIL